MYLEKITLFNFKNYQELELVFSPQINVFTGLNGSGKTNLLDAVHYLSLTKSAFNTNDALNINHGSDCFSIGGKFIKDKKDDHIQCGFSVAQKKILKLNKNPYEKMREHIGMFPVVLITPYDTDVIREGSEERRKFFDTILSQLDKNYLSELIRYNHILKNRNSLLRQFYERNYIDHDLIGSYDIQLLDSGKKIFLARKSFIKEFLPLFILHFENLTEKKEKVDLIYESQLEDEKFEQQFNASLQHDIARQRTSKGTHKDDFIFLIDEKPLKNFGSQGQQKSFVIAMKLAQYDQVKNNKGIKPILLLDDIFDKLDEERINKLMKMVAEDAFGQLFITDARLERTEKFFTNLTAKISIFNIENGAVKENAIEKELPQ
jgi:DNA replication and repair protein RecF